MAQADPVDPQEEIRAARKANGGNAARDTDITRAVLMGTDPGLRWGRRILRRLPTGPRCKLCASPFHGAGGPVMRLVGKGPWPGNPKYCSSCFKQMVEHRAGAEIECSFLFADVRGSTTLAEATSPREFRGLMDRFYQIASKILVEFDGIVDKFVGDEVIGLFIPALTGELHARRAIDAGRSLLKAMASGKDAARVTIGAGVNTGIAYVGTVGAGERLELSALGDPVNVTARLASAAAGGELLVTETAARAARLDEAGLERRELELKGKGQPVGVVVLGA